MNTTRTPKFCKRNLTSDPTWTVPSFEQKATFMRPVHMQIKQGSNIPCRVSS